MAEFIFMLTRHDETVEDCLAVMDEVADLGIRHIGFKDIGVDREVLHRLNRRILAAGATSYMEVVSTSREACIDSARVAVDVGVRRLMGGQAVAETLAIIAGTGIGYLPFPGRPVGHPTRLGGSPDEVAGDCLRFEAAGCAGVDLLAFRATESDPLALIRAARAALRGLLVVAGSIDSPQRIADVAAAGADAFTIGSAVFDGSFSVRKGSLRARLRDVLDACRTAPAVAAARA